MSARQRRLVSFAGTTLAIDYADAPIADLLEFLYRHIPESAAAQPDAVYRIVADAQTRQATLRRDGARIYQGAPDAMLAEQLLGDTCHEFAARCHAGLLFHAAGVAWRGEALLLPGAIGAGKTTLAGWLLTQGLHYLSDELMFAPTGSTHIQGFPRPLHLKARSDGTFPLALPTAPHDVQRAGSTALIAPTQLNPVAPVSNSLPLHLIIFPRYTPGSDVQMQPLSPAQAGLRLMECLVNARNLPDHGLADVVRLAQHAPAYQLHYADFSQIAGLIPRLW